MRRFRLSMRMRFILHVMLGIAGTALVTWILLALMNTFDIHAFIPSFFIPIIFGVAIGAVVNIYFGKRFFDPIMKLSRSMKQVAEGDFSVRLNPEKEWLEIKEIYENFNIMTEELGATEILQTDFVANVSHEFKTPINAIEGYATLLQGHGQVSAKEQNIYVEKILFNTQRLSKLVGNILLLSKIENQVIQSKLAVFRLDEQIRQSIVMLEPAWAAKNMELDVELDDVEYLGNESLLHHVWDNLIGNAIKFSPEGGCIHMKMKQTEEQIVFLIEDDGPGISEEEVKHIFDKFYQSDSSHKQEGNGLGLALVKKILNISNGKITVENRSAGGCRFTVVLGK